MNELNLYLPTSTTSSSEKRSFACSQCPYRTDRRNNLKRHTVTMHETNGAILECCGVKFASKAALRQHTVTSHSQGYHCFTCGRVFCRRALLRRHNAVHSGLKEFVCSLCEYATSHKSNLERHMKIHEGEHVPQELPSKKSLKRTGSHPILSGLLRKSESSDVSLTSHSRSGPSSPVSFMDTGIPSLVPYHSCAAAKSGPLYASKSQQDNVKFKNSLTHAIDAILGHSDENSSSGNSSSEESAGSNSPISPVRPQVSAVSNHWSGGLLLNTASNTQVPTGLFYPQQPMSSFPFFSAKDWYYDYSSAQEEHIDVVDHDNELVDLNNYVHEINRSTSQDSDEHYYIPKKLRMSKRYMEV